LEGGQSWPGGPRWGRLSGGQSRLKAGCGRIARPTKLNRRITQKRCLGHPTAMPLYEYKCAKCGEVFERLQKFSDEPLHEHPGCGGAVEKLVSPSALQFKGSGWYVNDYGRNGSAGKERSKAEPADSKKSEKTEAGKPAATPAKDTSSTTKSD
jgi:putative FmdB family regulatory protein